MFKMTFTLLVFLYLNSVYSQTNDSIDSKEHNLTSHFKKEFTYFQNNDFSNDDLNKLKQFKVLLVPGFLSDVFRKISKVTKTVIDISGYFDDQLGFLKGHNIDVEIVDLESEGPIPNNSKIIVQKIKNSDKPVILIGHSKGAVDMLDAILNMDKEYLKEKVMGLISIQAPFYGTPWTDDICNNRVIKFITNIILKLDGGTVECLCSVTPKRRSVYMKKNIKKIASLAKIIPIINFGSWIDRDTLNMMMYTHRKMLNMGLQNDGLVPLKSMFINDTFYISVQGIDHASTVMRNPLVPLDRYVFTQSLIKILSDII